MYDKKQYGKPFCGLSLRLYETGKKAPSYVLVRFNKLKNLNMVQIQNNHFVSIWLNLINLKQ